MHTKKTVLTLTLDTAVGDMEKHPREWYYDNVTNYNAARFELHEVRIGCSAGSARPWPRRHSAAAVADEAPRDFAELSARIARTNLLLHV